MTIMYDRNNEKSNRFPNKNAEPAPNSRSSCRTAGLFDLVQKFGGVYVALGGGLAEPFLRLGLVLFHAFAF